MFSSDTVTFVFCFWLNLFFSFSALLALLDCNPKIVYSPQVTIWLITANFAFCDVDRLLDSGNGRMRFDCLFALTRSALNVRNEWLFQFLHQNEFSSAPFPVG